MKGKRRNICQSYYSAHVILWKKINSSFNWIKLTVLDKIAGENIIGTNKNEYYRSGQIIISLHWTIIMHSCINYTNSIHSVSMHFLSRSFCLSAWLNNHVIVAVISIHNMHTHTAYKQILLQIESASWFNSYAVSRGYFNFRN